METGLFATAVYNAPVNNYPNGCHICELEIDRETGKVDITRYSVVDDVGTVLNPLLLHGQMHGGIAQGAGQALMEDIHFDTLGPARDRARSWTTPCRTRTISAPCEVESNPVPTKTNPLGVKGAGEAGCVGALPAGDNALVDALSEFGVDHIEMPATPERIWRAMQPQLATTTADIPDGCTGRRANSVRHRPHTTSRKPPNISREHHCTAS